MIAKRLTIGTATLVTAVLVAPTGAAAATNSSHHTAKYGIGTAQTIHRTTHKHHSYKKAAKHHKRHHAASYGIGTAVTIHR